MKEKHRGCVSLGEIKYCSPRCHIFKCAKNSAIYRGNDVWCRWTDEKCDVRNCNYATCIKRRLLPKGICGETVKRKTAEKKIDEMIGAPVKLKGKALRRVGEKEIF